MSEKPIREIRGWRAILGYYGDILAIVVGLLVAYFVFGLDAIAVILVGLFGLGVVLAVETARK